MMACCSNARALRWSSLTWHPSRRLLRHRQTLRDNESHMRSQESHLASQSATLLEVPLLWKLVARPVTQCCVTSTHAGNNTILLV